MKIKHVFFLLLFVGCLSSPAQAKTANLAPQPQCKDYGAIIQIHNFKDDKSKADALNYFLKHRVYNYIETNMKGKSDQEVLQFMVSKSANLINLIDLNFMKNGNTAPVFVSFCAYPTSDDTARSNGETWNQFVRLMGKIFSVSEAEAQQAAFDFSQYIAAEIESSNASMTHMMTHMKFLEDSLCWGFHLDIEMMRDNDGFCRLTTVTPDFLQFSDRCRVGIWQYSSYDCSSGDFTNDPVMFGLIFN